MTFHLPPWKLAFPALMVLFTFVGRAYFAMPYWGVWMGIVLILVHFLVLPRWAATSTRWVEHRLLEAAQAGARQELPGIFARAWLVRLYTPRWWSLGRQAWIAMEIDQLKRAEALYREASGCAPEPQRTTHLMNLATVLDRQGRDVDAEAIRTRIQRRRPDLALLMSVNKRDE